MICVWSPTGGDRRRALQDALARASKQSFNSWSVDGEMSTNDAVFALANGLRRQRAHLRPRRGTRRASQHALYDLCGELARAIAADGEGATKMLEVAVTGAPTEAIARDVAAPIAASLAGEGGDVRRRSELGARARHRRAPGPARRATPSIPYKAARRRSRA